MAVQQKQRNSPGGMVTPECIPEFGFPLLLYDPADLLSGFGGNELAPAFDIKVTSSRIEAD